MKVGVVYFSRAEAGFFVQWLIKCKPMYSWWMYIHVTNLILLAADDERCSQGMCSKCSRCAAVTPLVLSIFNVMESDPGVNISSDLTHRQVAFLTFHPLLRLKSLLCILVSSHFYFICIIILAWIWAAIIWLLLILGESELIGLLDFFCRNPKPLAFHSWEWYSIFGKATANSFRTEWILVEGNLISDS